MNKLLFTIAILVATSAQAVFAQTWLQLGMDIDGDVANAELGDALSISADGLTVAIGERLNDIVDTDAGRVQVFKFISGAWVQQGSDILGVGWDNQFGSSVSLSSDGSVLAIGAPGNSVNGDYSGQVRVFNLISGVWVQVGGDINGETTFDSSGRSISLSSDGLSVAIGATGNDGNGNISGHVRVYKFVSGTWTQQGLDIEGEAADDRSGSYVSINSDGLTVAIGAIENDGGGNGSGHVRVYKFISGAWSQQGADIDGEAAGDTGGFIGGGSVSISSDGLTVAMGATGNDGNGPGSGHVRVFKLISGSWVQQGLDIDGEAAQDRSGNSVSISSDGLTVAIGAFGNDGNGVDAGHVRVFQFISGTWVQKGLDIDGEAIDDLSGWSLGISADAQTVAIGTHKNDGNGVDAGHVRVFSFCVTATSAFAVTACKSYTVPSGDETYNTSQIVMDTIPTAAGCDSVMTIGVTINTVNASATQSSSTLSANAMGATYQWLDCNNSSATISGETAQVFTVTANGSYAVEVTENGCTDTSICYVITTIGIIENSFENELLVYPNPTSGSFSIDLGQQYQTIEISMTDINGKLIYRNTYNQSQLLTLEVNEPAGVYLFTVVSDDRNAVVRIMKE